MKALVLGAAGFLGANLVRVMVARGITPTCGRRPRTNVLTLRGLGVPYAMTDLESPEELRAAMTGHDVVFHLAGHYPKFSFDREGAIGTGLRQLEHVLDAAATTGVKRVIHVSSTATVAAVPGRASTEDDVFDAPPGFGTYHDLKWLLEARAREERRVDVVIACPGACIGPWDLRVGTSALLVALARGMDPKHPDGIVSIVDPEDVARGLLALAEAERPPPRLLLSGGSHALHALLDALALRYKVAPPSAPLSAAEATALADHAEHRAASAGGRPELSREIVDLVVHGAHLDASRSLPLVGAYTSLATTLDRFDAWAQRMRLVPRPLELEPT